MVKTKRGNFTTRRGKGPPSRRITITATDGKALYNLMQQRHGYSHAEAIAAILSGEVVTVLLADDDRAWLIKWLEQQAGLQHAMNARTLLSLARQLAHIAADEAAEGDKIMVYALINDAGNRGAWTQDTITDTDRQAYEVYACPNRAVADRIVLAASRLFEDENQARVLRLAQKYRVNA